MFSVDLGLLDLGSCFLENQGFFGLWLLFSEDQRFWILAKVFRDPRIFGSQLMFSADQRFRILAHVFRGPRVFGLWLMFSEDQRFGILAQEDQGFLDPISCFQRT